MLASFRRRLKQSRRRRDRFAPIGNAVDQLAVGREAAVDRPEAATAG